MSIVEWKVRIRIADYKIIVRFHFKKLYKDVTIGDDIKLISNGTTLEYLWIISRWGCGFSV